MVSLTADNAKLRDENRVLIEGRAQIEENVTTRVTRDLLSRRHDQEARDRMDAGALSSLTTRVDALAEKGRSSAVAPPVKLYIGEPEIRQRRTGGPTGGVWCSAS